MDQQTPYTAITPVALIIFRRPEATARALAAIRAARPGRLFIIADGPRAGRDGEAAQVAAARAVTEQIDWPCQVERAYAETNMGCKDRVASGLSWVFSQVERAIILEDDCVADLSFFRYCDELLDRYANRPEIMVVSGNNMLRGPRPRTSYLFSRYPHCAGWATWRRAWRRYDHTMARWPQVRAEGRLGAILGDPRAARFWTRFFDDVAADRVNSWAVRWTLTCWLEGGLSILPARNLVRNIGFDQDATHTPNGFHPLAGLPAWPMAFPMNHPARSVRDARADAAIQRLVYDPPLWARVWRRVGGKLKAES